MSVVTQKIPEIRPSKLSTVLLRNSSFTRTVQHKDAQEDLITTIMVPSRIINCCYGDCLYVHPGGAVMDSLLLPLLSLPLSEPASECTGEPRDVGSSRVIIDHYDCHLAMIHLICDALSTPVILIFFLYCNLRQERVMKKGRGGGKEHKAPMHLIDNSKLFHARHVTKN